MLHIRPVFTSALDGATNSCPFSLDSCHQTCCESRSPCFHITHTHSWLSRTLIHIPCQLELSSSPHPCSIIFTRSERLSTGALRERKLLTVRAGVCVCVCVATRPRRGQQTTKYTMSTGKIAPATEKWVVDDLFNGYFKSVASVLCLFRFLLLSITENFHALWFCRSLNGWFTESVFSFGSFFFSSCQIFTSLPSLFHNRV